MACIPSSNRLPDAADDQHVIHLIKDEVVGISLIASVGFISALSVTALLSYVAINYVKILRAPGEGSRKLIRTNIDALILNLLVAELIMALGAIMNIHWASKGEVSCGQACDAQGALQYIGETSVALFTIAITLLTFISVVRGWAIKARVWVWGSIMAAAWAYVALWAGIGGTWGGFYAPGAPWCWISAEYAEYWTSAQSVWLWIAGFGSILLYIPLFLLVRGNIKWDPVVGWASLKWRWKGEYGEDSNRLLWYPLGYITLVPVAILNWISYGGVYTSRTVRFTIVAIFNLSGVVSVGLILLARTNVLRLDYRSQKDARPQHTNNPLLSEDYLKEEAEDSTGFGGVRVMNPRDSSAMKQTVDRQGAL
ncbi:hypothetical protein RSOLAG1IB_09568 [Rhizoctonia solani AG-1 IB]|uniref:Uncharacterized protein n=1 Tax=Thanatephorus cucumeris (strain AG1-IB / isolate 7/3/14) TaxID=1108050 RepID=A0A0B7FRN6_THACB|nr:hypothetical protein RSOLAG1IB_09568 [Rhizoctonia solani AG-1 IB]